MYEYGNRWYEITIEGREELAVDRFKLPNGKTLFDDVHSQPGPKSRQLLALPRDCTVLVYYTKFSEPRRVPSALCKFTYETHHPAVKRFHGRTIRKPYRKKQEIEFVVKQYLTGLKLGTREIVLGPAIKTKTKVFDLPRLLFGRGVVLTTNPKSTGTYSPREQFGEAKRRLLSSPSSGFFVREQFSNPQYFVIPKSVQSTYGSTFLEDLKEEFAKLYGGNVGTEYEPNLLVYDDSVPNSVPSLGREILKTVESNFVFAGDAVVMIPKLSHFGNKEDELANLVMRELRPRGVHASIIHRESTFYLYEQSGEGQYKHWSKTTDLRQAKRLSGYLYNVILNKVLVSNSRWPFVLADGLRADLTIGIDIKNHTAGFTFFYGEGKDLRFFQSESTQSEQLKQIPHEDQNISIHPRRAETCAQEDQNDCNSSRR